MRQLFQHLRSQIKYTVILPYLVLMILVMLVGSGIAILLVAGSWQERFNNQLGQVARNFTQAFAQREINNIDYLGQIIFTAPNSVSGAPAVPQAMRARDIDGLELAMQGLWTLGLGQDKVDQDRLIVFDTAGQALLDWERNPAALDEPTQYIGTDLSQQPLVNAVLQGQTSAVPGSPIAGDKYSGLISFRAPDGTDNLHFFTVVPVTIVGPNDASELVGGLLVAQRLDRLLQYLQSQSQAEISTIYDVNGVAQSNTLGGTDISNLDMSADLIAQVAALNTATAQAGSRTGAQTDRCLDIGTLTGGLIAPLESTRLPTCSVNTTVTIGEREYQIVYAPLLIRGVQSGYFSIGLSRDFVLSAWASSRNAVIAVTTVLALLSVFVGLRVARQITRPLSDLVETAEAVSAGDLARRSGVHSADELGTLASAFNQMTEHLLQLYTVSRDLNSTIEVKRVLDVVADAARVFAPGAEPVVLLSSGEGFSYRIRSAAPPALAFLAERRVEASNPLLAVVATHNPKSDRMLIVDDLAMLAGAGLGDTQAQVVLAAPIFQQARLLGALLFLHNQPNRFGETEQQSLAVVANMAVAVLANAVLYSQVQQDAKQRQAILSSIGDGVLVCDERGRIVLLNRAAEQMLGLQAWELSRTRLADLPLKEIAQGKELFGNLGQQVKLNDRFLTFTRAPVVAEDGQIAGEVIVLHDITEAVHVDQAKTDFIATISHELRSPLTVIRGYIELLLRGTGNAKPTSDQADLLETVRTRAVEMTDMVNNAILIADIEAGKLNTELSAQDVELVLSMALAPIRGAFETKGLSVTLEIPDDLPAVLADREHLKQIFMQLLDNARRYTDKGGVTVRASTGEGVVYIDVIDTGPGIASEVLPRLFKRFQRVDGNNSQKRGGGLGLAIAKQLVDRQGGQVKAESTPGSGSTFSITLVQAHEQSLAVAQRNDDATTSA